MALEQMDLKFPGHPLITYLNYFCEIVSIIHFAVNIEINNNNSFEGFNMENVVYITFYIFM